MATASRQTRKAAPAAAARLKKIIAALEREHREARLALDFSTPLELLVALILAAQCTDAKVNEVTRSLFKRYRTAGAYASAPANALEEDVRPTGFYRQKTKAIRACCQRLLDCFGGEVPGELDDLLALPGVGRKTANILLGNAFGVPAIGVDTHVGRLAQRLGLSRQKDPNKIEADLAAVVPSECQVRFCHLIQYHGRRVCFARNPRCPECVLSRLCPYPGKTPPKPAASSPRHSRWMGQPGRRRQSLGSSNKRRV